MIVIYHVLLLVIKVTYTHSTYSRPDTDKCFLGYFTPIWNMWMNGKKDCCWDLLSC